MAHLSHVKYHILRDVQQHQLVADDTRASLSDPDLLHNRIAFVCLLTHPDGNIYCGLTSADSNILAKYDPRTERFVDLGYGKVAEPNEVKIHRSLELASDGTIYGATATLYTLDKRLQAPGGALFHYDPVSGAIRKLCIPCPRDYPQTITLDEKRQRIYGMTYPVFKFFVYHMDDGRVEDYDYMGSITHIGCVDDDGCYWGTWDADKHFLFKYDPVVGRIVYFNHGLPEGVTFANVMYRGAGPCDGMINGGNGYIYIGTTGGTLCRLDPKTARVDYLGRPYPTRRMPGLKILDERRILCAGGDEAGGFLAIYDIKTNGWNLLGPIQDEKTGLVLYRVHDLALSLDKKTAYIAETDVPTRSGYLWEARIG
jgi:hypothetical protein